MEESPPAATAPEEHAAPEQTSAQEEKPARERRRLRVPASVLVTVLVAALSVWVAPAFTRQWEDRQKARDLQAATAELISAGSASALGETLALADAPPDDVNIQRVRREWLVTRYRIQARLDGYFSSRSSMQWKAHAELVSRMIDVIRLADHPERASERASERCIGRDFYPCVRMFALNDAIRGFNAAESLWWRTRGGDQDFLTSYVVPEDFSPAGLRAYVAEYASEYILQSVGWVTDDVLNETPRGFSTTRRDLLHDLLP
jgi:hypothetical protein